MDGGKARGCRWIPESATWCATREAIPWSTRPGRRDRRAIPRARTRGDAGRAPARPKYSAGVAGYLGLSDEQHALLDLVRDITRREIAPYASDRERAGEFPRAAFEALGKAGLLGLVYPERYGGGEQPTWVYLLMLEELAAAHLAVGLGV
ncbi:MAG: acyl-CoA dehydrogenase family protein, partial [Actinobacteria bacterium]